MGIAIAGGSGLFLGLGLLIWGLGERKKRHAAERAADKAEQDRLSAVQVADQNARQAQKVEDFANRLDAEVMALRGRLNETRIRLAQCGDPKAVKAWLDSELEAEEL
jgi:small-conductance mechanosensitive channel